MTVKKYKISNKFSDKFIDDEKCIKINSKYKILTREKNLKQKYLKSKDSIHSHKNMHKNCLDWKLFNLDYYNILN